MLHRDQRGLALAIVSFVALVVVAGLLFALMNPAVTEVSSQMSTHSDNPTAQDQIDLAGKIWGLILFFIMFLGVLGLIVRATGESRGPT